MRFDEAAFFKETVDHIMSMDGPALNRPNGMCAYLTQDGRKCAAGKWIRPGAYSADFEGQGLSILFAGMGDKLHEERAYSIYLALEPEAQMNVRLLVELQRVHDESPRKDGKWHDRPLMVNRFRDVARDFRIILDSDFEHMMDLWAKGEVA